MQSTNKGFLQATANAFLKSLPIEVIWRFLSGWLLDTIKNPDSKNAKRAFDVLRLMDDAVQQAKERFPSRF